MLDELRFIEGAVQNDEDLPSMFENRRQMAMSVVLVVCIAPQPTTPLILKVVKINFDAVLNNDFVDLRIKPVGNWRAKSKRGFYHFFRKKKQKQRTQGIMK